MLFIKVRKITGVGHHLFLYIYIYIKSEVLDSDIDRTKATVKYWRRKEINRLGREAKSVPSPGTQKESDLLKA